MKKLLALVLALVMVLGLATIGANAAVDKTTFKDDASIEHKTAATVLNAIGVLKGDDNGSFNPTQALTREQAIKIVIYMIEGESANNLKAASAPFTDVAADRWSAGVIAEAKALKIVDGNGDGSFSPEAPLTSAAFGKMLLVALGYEDRYEGFTGSDWMLNVARLVNSTGLGDKIASIAFSGTMTRDDAAQMAYNCLEADMNQYNGALQADKYGNLGNGRATRGITSYWYDGTDDNVMQFCEAYFPNLHLDRKGQDDFGNPCAYWYLGNNRLDNDRTDAKTITTVTTADKVLTYTDAVKVKQIYKDLGLGANAAIGSVPGRNSYAVGNNGQVWIDGNTYGTGAAAGINPSGVADGKYLSEGIANTATVLTGAAAPAAPTAAVAAISAGDDAKIGGKGILTTVSYTQNDTYPVVITMKTTFLAKAVADYNASTKELKFTLQADTTTIPTKVSGDPADDDYFETALNAKEDDYFWVTGVDDGTTFEIKSFEPVTGLVSGAAVTAYKNTDTVTAGGTKYDYAKVAARAANGWDVGNNDGFNNLYTTAYTMDNGATYDVVLDPYGYVMYATEHDTVSKISDYVVVLAADITNLKAEAKLLFSDGSTKTVAIAKVMDKSAGGADYKVSNGGLTSAQACNYVVTNNSADLDGNTATNDPLQANRFYKFHVNKNGEYELTFVFDGAGTNQQTRVASGIDGGEVHPILATAALTANTKSTLLADEKAYDGIKNWVDVPANAGATMVTYLRDGQNANIILGAYTTVKGTNSAAKTDYYLLFNDETTKVDADGDTYFTYNALKDGELVTLDVTDGAGAGLAAAGADASTIAGGSSVAFYKVNSYEDGKADTFDNTTGAPIDTVSGAEPNGTGFLRCVAYASSTAALAGNEINIKNGTLTIGGTSWLLASNVKLLLVDGRVDKDHTPETTSAGALNHLEYDDGAAVPTATRDYYVYGMTDEDDSDTISILYVVRVK